MKSNYELWLQECERKNSELHLLERYDDMKNSVKLFKLGEIEMVHTLKELEEMFEHVNNAKYIIALKYCRQRLEQEIRIEKQALELVVTHKKYDVEKPSKEDIKAALKINNEISKIINNYIKSEAKKHELNFGSILFQKGENNEK